MPKQAKSSQRAIAVALAVTALFVLAPAIYATSIAISNVGVSYSSDDGSGNNSGLGAFIATSPTTNGSGDLSLGLSYPGGMNATFTSGSSDTVTFDIFTNSGSATIGQTDLQLLSTQVWKNTLSGSSIDLSLTIAGVNFTNTISPDGSDLGWTATDSEHPTATLTTAHQLGSLVVTYNSATITTSSQATCNTLAFR